MTSRLGWAGWRSAAMAQAASSALPDSSGIVKDGPVKNCVILMMMFILGIPPERPGIAPFGHRVRCALYAHRRLMTSALGVCDDFIGQTVFDGFGGAHPEITVDVFFDL